MVTESCKKIEPVAVKLCSKTSIPLFSEHGVSSQKIIIAVSLDKEVSQLNCGSLPA